MSTPEEGLEKSALLLMTLGSDEASEVLKHLGPREVQKLGMTMAGLPPQPRSRVEAILDELDLHAAKGAPIEPDEAHIREMLTKALGDDRAAHIISRIMHGSDTAGIESLKWMDAATAADLIRNEHPQIIATILVHLEFDQAGEILKQFSDRLRNDVLLRIATLDGVQPIALKELNEALTRMLAAPECLPAPAPPRRPRWGACAMRPRSSTSSAPPPKRRCSTTCASTILICARVRS